MDGVAGQGSALEGKHDAGGKDGVEKGEGVADEDKAVAGAMAGVLGVFAGEAIGAGGLAVGEVLLDPLVLLDFAVENFLRVFHAVARQVFSFGDDADADHVVVLGDVPEPAFFGNVGDGGGAGVDAFVALGAFIVGPDGDFVEVGIVLGASFRARRRRLPCRSSRG